MQGSIKHSSKFKCKFWGMRLDVIIKNNQQLKKCG